MGKLSSTRELEVAILKQINSQTYYSKFLTPTLLPYYKLN